MSKHESKQKKLTYEEKIEKGARKFWSAFLFTKDGRAKSGFGVYSFFLSLLFMFAYGGIIVTLISYLNAPLSAAVAPWVENLIESLCTAFIAILLIWVFHYIIPDKRMMFATHIWLIVYIIASIITVLIFLKGTGTYGLFFTFLAWFVLIPVSLGTIFSFILFKKDYKPEQQVKPEPEYMKYIRRR